MTSVSVVIPAYNAAAYVGAAIDSVLAQTLKDLEIIVVDDGSTDETPLVLERFGSRIRAIRQQNRGVSAARNRGIDESHGRYVAFLDADDLWLPAKLQRQIEALAADGVKQACYTSHLLVTEQLRPLRAHRSPRRSTALDDLLARGNVIGSPSSVVCERELFSAAGGFDEAFSLCADWEMWLRIAARTDFLYVDEPLVQYRVRSGSMSSNVPTLERESLAILRRGFDAHSRPLHARRRSSFAFNYMVLAGSYLRAGSFGDAARCVLQSLMRDPRQATQLFSYADRLASGRTGERAVTQTSMTP